MPSADQIADHARDYRKHESSPRHQKRAVQQLTGYCWGLIGAGILSPDIEKQLRARIRNTCLEFDMDPPAELPKLSGTEILAAFDGMVPR